MTDSDNTSVSGADSGTSHGSTTFSRIATSWISTKLRFTDEEGKDYALLVNRACAVQLRLLRLFATTATLAVVVLVFSDPDPDNMWMTMFLSLWMSSFMVVLIFNGLPDVVMTKHTDAESAEKLKHVVVFRASVGVLAVLSGNIVLFTEGKPSDISALATAALIALSGARMDEEIIDGDPLHGGWWKSFSPLITIVVMVMALCLSSMGPGFIPAFVPMLATAAMTLALTFSSYDVSVTQTSVTQIATLNWMKRTQNVNMAVGWMSVLSVIVTLLCAAVIVTAAVWIVALPIVGPCLK